MFRKRAKKYFPPGTFIPTPARVMAILQLCIAFTLILWNASAPFMEDLFNIKSKMVVFHYVMGMTQPENSHRFNQLPAPIVDKITRDYKELQEQLSRSFFEKIESAFKRILFEIPPFELAWIFFSIVISILLLLRIEGAIQTVWLLPLLAGAYAVDNRFNGNARKPTQEELLFPSEAYIVHHHLTEPLSQNIFEQQTQLQKGWELYLIENWAKQIPSNESTLFRRQVAQGEFNFNVERLQRMAKEIDKTPLRESNLLLALYIFWNLSFALIVNQVYSTKGNPSLKKA